jgi:hypothetical protein
MYDPFFDPFFLKSHSIREVAEYMGCTEAWIRGEIARGHLRARKKFLQGHLDPFSGVSLLQRFQEMRGVCRALQQMFLFVR